MRDEVQGLVVHPARLRSTIAVMAGRPMGNRIVATIRYCDHMAATDSAKTATAARR